MPQESVGREVTLWICQMLVAGVLIAAALAKFVGLSSLVEVFARIGLGQWLRYAIGALELVTATLLLIPAASQLGALLALGLMAAVMAVKLSMHTAVPALSVVLFAASAIVVWGRRRRPPASNGAA